MTPLPFPNLPKAQVPSRSKKAACMLESQGNLLQATGGMGVGGQARGSACLSLPSSPGGLPRVPAPHCLGFRTATLGPSPWEPGLPVSVGSASSLTSAPGPSVEPGLLQCSEVQLPTGAYSGRGAPSRSSCPSLIVSWPIRWTHLTPEPGRPGHRMAEF